MRWTRAVPLTNGADADGEVVWFWRPDAGVKSAIRSAGDGVKQAWSPGRARRKPLKPLRGECRVISGVTVVTMLVCYFYFACEAAGASCARHSLRPLIPRGEVLAKTRTHRAARSRSCVFLGCRKLKLAPASTV